MHLFHFDKTEVYDFNDQVRYKEKYDFGIAPTSQMKMDPIIESKSMRINIKVMVLVYDFDWSKRNNSWYMLDHKKWHDISISYMLHDFPSMKKNLWLIILTQTGIGCEFNYHLQTKFHFLNKIFGQQNWSHKRQTLSILQVIPMVVYHRYPSLLSNT